MGVFVEVRLVESTPTTVVSHMGWAGIGMKTVPMVAEVVEAATAQAKRGQCGYENEFDGILLHKLFFG